MELQCFCRQACSTKDGALASDCHVGKLLLLDKKAPSRLLRLLRGDARPRSSQAYEMCRGDCDGQLRPVRRSNLSAMHHCIIKAPTSQFTQGDKKPTKSSDVTIMFAMSCRGQA